MTQKNDENKIKSPKPLDGADPYQTLFANMLDGIFQTDLDGNFTLVNPSYAEIHGYKPEEMYKINMSQTWVSQEEWNLVFREIRKRDLKNILEHYARKDGSTGWLELSIRTKLDAEGNPIACEGMARDVTERRVMELAEKESSERAEFLIDLMVHDLNNINQGMMLPLELVSQDPSLSLKHKRPIEMAIAQIQRSTELIRNVKKLQAVIQQPVEPERKDLLNEIVKAADAVKGAFPSKELDLRINIREGEVFVNADDFLPDLFFNLLHNSMKFDKKQVVVVEIIVNRRGDGKVAISVADHGPGIPDEEKTRVLLRKRGGKGSGMGLTLVKYLVERYHGSLSLQDRVSGKPGKGTTACITFLEG